VAFLATCGGSSIFGVQAMRPDGRIACTPKMLRSAAGAEQY